MLRLGRQFSYELVEGRSLLFEMAWNRDFYFEEVSYGSYSLEGEAAREERELTLLIFSLSHGLPHVVSVDDVSQIAHLNDEHAHFELVDHFRLVEVDLSVDGSEHVSGQFEATEVEEELFQLCLGQCEGASTVLDPDLFQDVPDSSAEQSLALIVPLDAFWSGR